MAELVEKDTEAWYKMDPDPFDYRHPGEYVLIILVYTGVSHLDKTGFMPPTSMETQ